MKTRRYKAFTLVETLAVLAILGVVLSLLLPAMAKFKREAWRLDCRVQQREVARTAVAMSTERGGVPMPNHRLLGEHTRAFNESLGVEALVRCKAGVLRVEAEGVEGSYVYVPKMVNLSACAQRAGTFVVTRDAGAFHDRRFVESKSDGSAQ